MSKLTRLVENYKQAIMANQRLRPVSIHGLRRVEKCGDLSSFLYSNGKHKKRSRKGSFWCDGVERGYK